MSRNPFYQHLDWLVKGKYIRVRADKHTYCGWGAIANHNDGSIILHDAVNEDTNTEVGSVFLHSCESIEVIKPTKKIEMRRLKDLKPYPAHNTEFSSDDEVMRRSYRNKSTGSYPVIRENGTIINGHKRINSAIKAGLSHHPVEVINVSDDEAEELFKLAHSSGKDDTTSTQTTNHCTDSNPTQRINQTTSTKQPTPSIRYKE